MKTIKLLAMCATFLLMACKPIKQLSSGHLQERPEDVVSNAAPLATGDYFIVNDDNLALTPLNPTVGENVFLRNFNHGGMQQWHITRTPNATTYTIKLVGSDAMFFQPYYVPDHTPMIGPGKSISFRIVPAAGSTQRWLIKSLKYNGDALHSYVFSPNLPTEMRFNPSDGGRKFMWHFVRITE